MINKTLEYQGVAKTYFSYVCGSLVSTLSAGDLIVSGKYAKAIQFTAALGSVLYMINGSIAMGKSSGDIGIPLSVDKLATISGYTNIANFKFIRELDSQAASIKGFVYFDL
jgi:hypothetical protein